MRFLNPFKKQTTPAPTLTTSQKAFMSDGLVNFVTGLGSNVSKRSHARWTLGELAQNWRELEIAYQTSGLVRRVIDTVANDVTREWREIKCDKAKEVAEEEDRLRVVSAVRDAVRWARLYGGSGMVMITDQPLEKPLDVNKIKKGSLKNLIVLDRWYFGSGSIQSMDVLSRDYMMPEYFLVTGSQNAYIHKSHVVRFTGSPLPPRLQIANYGWGDSVLRQVLQEIEDLLAANGGIAESLQEFNVDIIKRENLFTDITTDQEPQIMKRFQLFSMMKSAIRTAVLDGSEDYERKEVSYSGVADMVRLLMHMVSTVTHIPFTRLYGASAEGLNATGQGDEHNYNDFLRSTQNSDIDPALRQLDEVLVRSALGVFPEEFSYEWNPLTTPTPVDLATANKIQAEADQIYLDANIVTPSQVMRNLSTSEAYVFDEERIKQVEELEADQDLESIYSNAEPSEDTGTDVEQEGQEPEDADNRSGRVPTSDDQNDPTDQQGSDQRNDPKA